MGHRIVGYVVLLVHASGMNGQRSPCLPLLHHHRLELTHATTQGDSGHIASFHSWAIGHHHNHLPGHPSLLRQSYLLLTGRGLNGVLEGLVSVGFEGFITCG